jgi:hypothetical protein
LPDYNLTIQKFLKETNYNNLLFRHKLGSEYDFHTSAT